MAQSDGSVAALKQLKRQVTKHYDESRDWLIPPMVEGLEAMVLLASPSYAPSAIRCSLLNLESVRKNAMDCEGSNPDPVRVGAYDLIKSLHVTLHQLNAEKDGSHDPAALERAADTVLDAFNRTNTAYIHSSDGLLSLLANALECMVVCLGAAPVMEDVERRLLMLEAARKLQVQIEQKREHASPLRLALLAVVKGVQTTLVHISCGGAEPSLLGSVKREKDAECLEIGEEEKENRVEGMAEMNAGALVDAQLDDPMGRGGGGHDEGGADIPIDGVDAPVDPEPVLDGLGGGMLNEEMDIKAEDMDMQPDNFFMGDGEAVKKEEPLDDFPAPADGWLNSMEDSADAQYEAEYPDDEVELAEEEQALDQQLFGQEDMEDTEQAEDSSARAAVVGGVERRRASRLVARSAQSTQQVDGPAAKQKKRSRGKQGKRVEKTSDTEMECPECEYRHRKIRPLVLHLRQRHSTTPTLAGIVFRCECGHESFSHRHSIVCKVANFTVIRKSDGPIRRLNDKKTTPQCIVCEKHPSTVTAYARHLKEHHKSTLKESGIYLICGCGDKQYEMKRGPSHNKKCDGRQFTLHKVANNVAKARGVRKV